MTSRTECTEPEEDNDPPAKIASFDAPNEQRRLLRYSVRYWLDGCFLVEDAKLRNVAAGIWRSDDRRVQTVLRNDLSSKAFSALRAVLHRLST